MLVSKAIIAITERGRNPFCSIKQNRSWAVYFMAARLFDISLRNNAGQCLFVKRRWMPQLVVITHRAPIRLSTLVTFRERPSAFIHLIRHAPLCWKRTCLHFYRCGKPNTVQTETNMPASTINAVPFNSIKVSTNTSMNNVPWDYLLHLLQGQSSIYTLL